MTIVATPRDKTTCKTKFLQMGLMMMTLVNVWTLVTKTTMSTHCHEDLKVDMEECGSTNIKCEIPHSS